MPTLTETNLPSDEWFTTVAFQGHPGQECIGEREQHRFGDVIDGADPSGWIGITDMRKVLALAVLAKRIPCTRIDDARRDGVDPDRGELDSLPWREPRLWRRGRPLNAQALSPPCDTAAAAHDNYT